MYCNNFLSLMRYWQFWCTKTDKKHQQTLFVWLPFKQFFRWDDSYRHAPSISASICRGKALFLQGVPEHWLFCYLERIRKMDSIITINYAGKHFLGIPFPKPKQIQWFKRIPLSLSGGTLSRAGNHAFHQEQIDRTVRELEQQIFAAPWSDCGFM